ncbi:Cell wall-active antibiotics response 4TMS YvqF [Sinosporangium album]|uniref:Cell wall-active antibiotics response 4TMS YvqF n=1 Tax=Sinosporangium album TaxID=504805 RepID=A0A1G8BMI5_9ACTN|nr:DUF1707 domain-containing protein [Sinosporangium album]SDH34429.1 Cell wall-active antibiotics response 4TMS YvqF [Sinosporangium album]
MNDPGLIRASDAEREAVVERLREASVEGRLTLAELTERTGAAYTAQTRAELVVITSDLPAARTAMPLPAREERGGKARKWFVAVMGDSKRKGKWRIDHEIGAVAVMGDVTLDLRQAEVRGNEIDIVATAVMGDVKIIVPDGVDVELEGIAIMGDKKLKVQEAPAGMNVPLIRIKAYAVLGDVKVVGDSHAGPVALQWSAWREKLQEVRRELLEDGSPRHGLPPHHGPPHHGSPPQGLPQDRPRHWG